jgi:hypothetical protein
MSRNSVARQQVPARDHRIALPVDDAHVVLLAEPVGRELSLQARLLDVEHLVELPRRHLVVTHLASAELGHRVVVRVVQLASRLVVQAIQHLVLALVLGQQRLREVLVVQLFVGALLEQRTHLVEQGADGDDETGSRLGRWQHPEDGVLMVGWSFRSSRAASSRARCSSRAALLASLRRRSASFRSTLVALSSTAPA